MKQKPGTTFRIDDDLKQAIKVKAAEENTTLTAVVNDFLRAWVAGNQPAPVESAIAKRQRTLVKHLEGIRVADPVIASALESTIGTIYRRLSGTDTIAAAVANGRAVARRISDEMGGNLGRGTGTRSSVNEDD